jgi:hypothetical protein
MEQRRNLKMKCAACGKERERKHMMFTKDQSAYCPNPFECKHDLHPNSVKNIVNRGGSVDLLTMEEIDKDVLKNLNLTPEMRDRIQKVATKPQSIRLNRQDIAYYLLKLQETHNMASISEAVRYCVNYAMENAPIETKKNEMFVVNQPNESSLVEQTKGVHGALTGIVIPNIPKSVNVDWDNLPPLEPKKEEEEEEEFTF